MIKVLELGKSYGSTVALKNISFEIGTGEIVGILGQNGAGKTTLMRILTTYLQPSSGKVMINERDVTRSSLEIRKGIGYLPETPPLYMSMRVVDYLKFAAQLRNVLPKDQKKRVEQVLNDCDLQEVRNKIIGTLSKGYKQRAGIAQAIINDPAILILDEPTSGLDPVQVQQIRKLIKNIEKRRTVILSTHILSEIEQMAQRVIIIKKGSIIKDSSLEEMLKDHSNLEEAFLKTIGFNTNE
ncbi:MAG: ABC transporter ATP-binding protein [Candidatus Omnitrophica bacterium]|nr:ABC transporter ATP-binding protein [Candidatus Omnitrophota bacterium]